jgi:hypothetical protein
LHIKFALRAIAARAGAQRVACALALVARLRAADLPAGGAQLPRLQRGFARQVEIIRQPGLQLPA